MFEKFLLIFNIWVTISIIKCYHLKIKEAVVTNLTIRIAMIRRCNKYCKRLFTKCRLRRKRISSKYNLTSTHFALSAIKSVFGMRINQFQFVVSSATIVQKDTKMNFNLFTFAIILFLGISLNNVDFAVAETDYMINGKVSFIVQSLSNKVLIKTVYFQNPVRWWLWESFQM